MLVELTFHKMRRICPNDVEEFSHSPEIDTNILHPQPVFNCLASLINLKCLYHP